MFGRQNRDQTSNCQSVFQSGCAILDPRQLCANKGSTLSPSRPALPLLSCFRDSCPSRSEVPSSCGGVGSSVSGSEKPPPPQGT